MKCDVHYPILRGSLTYELIFLPSKILALNQLFEALFTLTLICLRILIKHILRIYAKRHIK